MTGQEFLNQAIIAERSVAARFEEVQRLRDTATSITPSYGTEAVSHTRNVDRLAVSVERIMEAEQKLNEEIDQMLLIKESVRNAISQINDTYMRTILEQKYLNNHSIKEIAIEIGKRERWTYELHRRAVEEIEKLTNALQ